MIDIQINWDVTPELIELYSESTTDPFVGEKDGPYGYDRAKVELEKIVDSGRYAKYDRLGIMKIFCGETLIWFSFPREVLQKEHEWFKLNEINVYYRVGTVYINPEYRGKGYMTETIALFRKEYGHVMWTCDINNRASKSVAEKAGLKMTHNLYFNAEKEWFFEEPVNCVRTSLVFSSE